MSIMGIDPGIANTGLAVIYESEDGDYYLCGEHIKTKAGQPIEDRVGHIAERVRDFIIEVKPSMMFIEDVFFARNKNSAITTGMIIGSCIYLARIHNLKLGVIKPNEMKKVLTNNVKASKIEVEESVREKVFSVDDKLSNHVIDAIGVALTGAYKIDGKSKEAI